MNKNIDIRLDDPDIVDYQIKDRTIWLKTEAYETFVRIPRVTRASYWKYDGRGVVHVGAVKVSGPTPQVKKIWDMIVEN